MLSRRIAAARPLARTLPTAAARPRFVQTIQAPNTPHKLTEVEELQVYDDITDPYMNGGYINPPVEKRGNRDPYGEWWDKQERRNFGEPVHEDNDILGVFALHDYTHFTPGWGAVLWGFAITATLGLCGVVKLIYPDKISVPKSYEDGLEAELGGPRAVRARAHGEEVYWKH